MTATATAIKKPVLDLEVLKYINKNQHIKYEICKNVGLRWDAVHKWCNINKPNEAKLSQKIVIDTVLSLTGKNLFK